ncbi:bola protein, partial [Crassisporium funariophilum]
GERVIHTKLTEKFTPSQLQVQDVSGGCGTFYAITIASQAFQGLPIVKQHRLVTETLKSEIEGIHGLQVR